MLVLKYTGTVEGLSRSELATLVGELYDLDATAEYRVDWSNIVYQPSDSEADNRVVLTVEHDEAEDNFPQGKDELAAELANLSAAFEDDQTAYTNAITIENEQ
jgi:hypothetical protein